jgi:hypothetical protein
MPAFLDTRSRTRVALRICARCSRKFPYDELSQDPNFPGLFVCADDLDQFDPWRLPARAVENITLEYPRPDVHLVPGPMPIYANQIQAQVAANDMALGTGLSGQTVMAAPPVTVEQQPAPWAANKFYPLGAQVTPTNPYGMLAAGEEVYVFLCIVPGVSSPNEPFRDFTVAISAMAGPDPIPPPPMPPDVQGQPWAYEPYTGLGIGVNAIGEAAIEGQAPGVQPPPVPYTWIPFEGVTVNDGGCVWLCHGLFKP